MVTMRVALDDIKNESDAEALIDQIAEQWTETTEPEILAKLYAVYGTIGTPQPGAEHIVQTPKYHCRPGCSWCCYLSVEVLPGEVDNLVNLIKRLPVFLQLKVRDRFAAIANKNYDPAERLKARVPCPFLDADKLCGIYSYRPYACRVHHSMKRDACKEDYYTVANNVLSHQRPEMVIARTVMWRAALKVLKRNGGRTETVEMSQGIHQKLNERKKTP